MISKEERKAAIQKCKERKAVAGIYSLRCVATGAAWVGATRNVEAAKNAAWFGLRQGVHLSKTLQLEWNRRGEEAFVFEVLERMDEDAPAMGLSDWLKARKAYWVAARGAEPLL